jgi:hypothetical protein
LNLLRSRQKGQARQPSQRPCELIKRSRRCGNGDMRDVRGPASGLSAKGTPNGVDEPSHAGSARRAPNRATRSAYPHYRTYGVFRVNHQSLQQRRVRHNQVRSHGLLRVNHQGPQPRHVRGKQQAADKIKTARKKSPPITNELAGPLTDNHRLVKTVDRHHPYQQPQPLTSQPSSLQPC